MLGLTVLYSPGDSGNEHVSKADGQRKTTPSAGALSVPYASETDQKQNPPFQRWNGGFVRCLPTPKRG